MIFNDETEGRVALLPLPGHEDLWGRWACTGNLVEVYRQTGEGFELVPGDVSRYGFATVQ